MFYGIVKTSFSHWKRFFFVLGAMGVVNLLPLLASWKAYRTDGMEIVGWPLTFRERGGFSYIEEFYLFNLLIDVAIAVAVSVVGARLLRNGPAALIRHLRNWPVPQGKGE
jgi:hypothetical protein